ncbi:uncharacterized protein LOC131251321 [Magnolia sinica]|uniref:uncharacterized protein LOC131251321 n=1 Tax=Magnolia sinica TaxID=86752 RepID=UPI00265967AF|nr:uncharacterized protein LOC131251321 [Magnolia sinica]
MISSGLLCSSFLPVRSSSSSPSVLCTRFGRKGFEDSSNRWCSSWPHHQLRKEVHVACGAQKDAEQQQQQKQQLLEEGVQQRRGQQIVLWAAESAYVLWLFLLPYAPGDPVWAIKPDTIDALLGLSLNFFFILPFANSVGIHVIESPVLHPVSEGLFNFVIGWTLMFAPLIYTDCKRDRYRGSLDLLWGLQMFLTNIFLIPYMAIRLNDDDSNYAPRKLSKLGSIMTSGAPIVGLIGGAVCLLSAWWAFSGRGNYGFGSLEDRWEFFSRYIGSERLAYAFIWDICLYAVFQPWLIGDNLQNVQESKVGIVSTLRYIPVVGLVAYLLSLNYDREL